MSEQWCLPPFKYTHRQNPANRFYNTCYLLGIFVSHFSQGFARLNIFFLVAITTARTCLRNCIRSNNHRHVRVVVIASIKYTFRQNPANRFCNTCYLLRIFRVLFFAGLCEINYFFLVAITTARTCFRNCIRSNNHRLVRAVVIGSFKYTYRQNTPLGGCKTFIAGTNSKPE